ncbi:MAG: PEP-CTERM sorting domain-containing protein [Chthoniobacterales bacterium]
MGFIISWAYYAKESNPPANSNLPPSKIIKSIKITPWKFLALSAAGFVLSVTPAFAAWTYTGPGTMTGTQDFSDAPTNTYDMGPSDDGASINATLNISSGTLTLTANIATLGNGAASPAGPGTINATGGTLNIINRYWQTSIGQHVEAAGSSVNISGGATVNWDITSQGWSQQRLVIANGPFNSASASINLIGGTFAVTSANSGDDGRGVYVGPFGNNSVGTINLTTGTFSVSGAIPFGLGGNFSSLNSTAVWASGNGASKINITDGIFKQTGFTLATGLSTTASTFMIGTNSYVNFISGGTGALSLQGWDQSSFDALVTAGQIKLNGAAASISDFSFSSADGQGIYGLASVPEPTTIATLLGGIGMLALFRRRGATPRV